MYYSLNDIIRVGGFEIYRRQLEHTASIEQEALYRSPDDRKAWNNRRGSQFYGLLQFGAAYALDANVIRCTADEANRIRLHYRPPYPPLPASVLAKMPLVDTLAGQVMCVRHFIAHARRLGITPSLLTPDEWYRYHNQGFAAKTGQVRGNQSAKAMRSLRA